MQSGWIIHLGLLAGFLKGSLAFTFNTSTPEQCAPFTIQWDGGEEPFQFLLVPTIEIQSGRILNITLPTGLSQPYSYTFDLSAPSGLEFLATMSDSTGFGAGGTTPVLTVGSSDNTSCLESNLLYDFTFSLSPETSPAQCSSQTVTWQDNVTRPVHLFGLIPGGTAWEIPIPQSGITYDWQVNIASGTEYLLAMADSGPYVTGGSSSLITVASGSDSCMNSTSPRAGGSSGSGTASSSAGSTGSSTSVAPSSSVSGVGGTSGGGQSNEGKNETGGSGSSTNIGAIVGGVVGGIALLFLLALLFFCLRRRRSRSRRDSSDPMIRSYGVNGASSTEKRRSAGVLDLLAGRQPRRQFSDDSATETREGGQEYQPSPFPYHAPSNRSTGPSATTGGTNQAGEKMSPLIPTMTNASENRYSSDTYHTEHTGSFTPPTALHATSRPVSTASASQFGTAGHSPDVRRHSSISKAPYTPPAANTALDSNVASPGQRIVQHEDSGEVVDLPPRYDQLRARNPDPE